MSVAQGAFRALGTNGAGRALRHPTGRSPRSPWRGGPGHRRTGTGRRPSEQRGWGRARRRVTPAGHGSWARQAQGVGEGERGGTSRARARRWATGRKLVAVGAGRDALGARMGTTRPERAARPGRVQQVRPAANGGGRAALRGCGREGQRPATVDGKRRPRAGTGRRRRARTRPRRG